MLRQCFHVETDLESSEASDSRQGVNVVPTPKTCPKNKNGLGK